MGLHADLSNKLSSTPLPPGTQPLFIVDVIRRAAVAKKANRGALNHVSTAKGRIAILERAQRLKSSDKLPQNLLDGRNVIEQLQWEECIAEYAGVVPGEVAVLQRCA